MFQINIESRLPTTIKRSGKIYSQRGRDSNPRYAFGVYTLSRRAPSTTRPPLFILNFILGCQITKISVIMKINDAVITETNVLSPPY